MTNCPKCHEPGIVEGEGYWTCESCGYVWTGKPGDHEDPGDIPTGRMKPLDPNARYVAPDGFEYDPAEDADSELVGNPPEEPLTVTPTHGASPEPTMRVIVMDGDEVGEATLDIPGLDHLLRDIFG